MKNIYDVYNKLKKYVTLSGLVIIMILFTYIPVMKNTGFLYLATYCM